MKSHGDLLRFDTLEQRDVFVAPVSAQPSVEQMSHMHRGGKPRRVLLAPGGLDPAL
jgi:hypothetical protein